MTRTIARTAAAGSVLTILLALAGCAPAATTPVPASSSTSGPAGAGSPDGASSSDAASASCPVGRWILDNDSWAASLTAIMAADLPGAVVSVDGELLLDWHADGGYLLTASDSRYIVSADADGSSLTMTIHHDGTESGTWTGAGPGYDLVATDESGWSSVVQMESGGVTQTIDQSALPTAPWSGSMLVSCAAGSMTTTVEEAAGAVSVTFLARSSG